MTAVMKAITAGREHPPFRPRGRFWRSRRGSSHFGAVDCTAGARSKVANPNGTAHGRAGGKWHGGTH